MTPEQFTYWLQGYAELNAAPPSAEQWQSIRDHLATVFNKVTPPMRLTEPQVPYQWPGIDTGPSGYPRITCTVASPQTDARTIC